MKSNLYALLPDDAEDATEGVVSRTTSTSVEKPKASSASSVASSTKTNKVKIPHVDALPVAEEEDTTLAEEEVRSGVDVVHRVVTESALYRKRKNTLRTSWKSLMCQ
jgi:hypothetical protein